MHGTAVGGKKFTFELCSELQTRGIQTLTGIIQHVV